MQNLSVYLHDWLALRSGGLRPRTIESYESLIRLYVSPAIGDVPVDQLRNLHILAGV